MQGKVWNVQRRPQRGLLGHLSLPHVGVFGSMRSVRLPGMRERLKHGQMGGEATWVTPPSWLCARGVEGDKGQSQALSGLL